MMPVVLDGATLTCIDVARIANGAPVQLAESAHERMLASASAFAAHPSILRQKRKFLIGEGAQEGDDLIRSFILGHCAGVGEALPAGQVRALIACRANVFAVGASGVRPALVEAMCTMLNSGVVPIVPSQGSVGAAGDLAPLAHVARVLCGYGGLVQLPDGSIGQSPLLPYVPSDKEALSLINGATLTAALSALAVHGAVRLIHAAVEACAMTMAVTRADPRAIQHALVASRRQPGGLAVAAQLRSLLGENRPSRSPDAFSVRAAPAVIGTAADTLAWVQGVVEAELNAACDNPLWFPDEGILEGGNFHGAPVAVAMDTLRIALTQMGTQSERRTFRLTAASLTGDLPSFLVAGTGLNSGFMLAQYTAASLASECKGLSHPAAVDSIPTIQHHEDHVSMGPIGARLTLRVLDNVRHIVAIEMLLAAQGLDWRIRGQRVKDGMVVSGEKETISEPILTLHTRVRAVTPFWEDDQPMHPAIQAVAKMLNDAPDPPQLRVF